MRRQNRKVGIVLLSLSTIIYSFTLLSAAIYSKVLISGGIGWNKNHGVFGTALREIGTLPIIIAAIFGASGITLLIMSVKNRK